jgi:hypothetical protein
MAPDHARLLALRAAAPRGEPGPPALCSRRSRCNGWAGSRAATPHSEAYLGTSSAWLAAGHAFAVHDERPCACLQINSHALHTLGPHLEMLAGPQRFMATYLLSAAVGTAASVVGTPAPSVGASGVALCLASRLSSCLCMVALSSAACLRVAVGCPCLVGGGLTLPSLALVACCLCCVSQLAGRAAWIAWPDPLLFSSSHQSA